MKRSRQMSGSVGKCGPPGGTWMLIPVFALRLVWFSFSWRGAWTIVVTPGYEPHNNQHVNQQHFYSCFLYYPGLEQNLVELTICLYIWWYYFDNHSQNPNFINNSINVGY